jgi:uncharacterized protein YneF (UPF0154 family)
MLVTLAGDQAVTEEACLAIVNVAAKRELREAPKDLRQKALQTVVEKSGNDASKKRAQELLNRIQ